MPNEFWKFSVCFLTLVTAAGCNRIDRLKTEGGVRLVYEVDRSRLAPGAMVDGKMLAAAVSQRIDAGPRSARRVVAGPGDGVTVILVGNDEAERSRVKRLLATQGKLEFRILADQDADAPMIERAAKGDVRTADMDARRSDDDPEVQFLVKLANEAEQEPGANTTPVNLIYIRDRPRAAWRDIAADQAANVAENKDLVMRTLPSGQMQKLIILGELRAQWVRVGKTERGTLRIQKYGTVAREGADGETEILVLMDPQDVQGKHLVSAHPSVDPHRGSNMVDFEFGTEGSRLFGTLTGNNVPRGELVRRLGIILDGEVLTAPRLNERISSKGQISGDFTKNDVEWLAAVLESGMLPVPLKPAPVREERIAPGAGP